jgi:aryl sulfotransferase
MQSPGLRQTTENVMPDFTPGATPERRYVHLDWDSARWTGFRPRAGDVFVCTCYKSGTTWMQMIVALLAFQSTEFPGRLSELSPWLDLVTGPVDDEIAKLDAQTHRRILKTHTPLDGLPWYPDARYIYVGRDPRDVFVSLMNHQANLNKETERAMARESGQDTTVTDLLPDNVDEALATWLTRGFFDWESDGYPWWSQFHHGETFWQHRDRDNILTVHYADLKADLDGQMRRISAFLDIPVDEAVWPDLVQAARFESMKRRADDLAPAAEHDLWTDNSRFFNKGESGQWRGMFSAANLDLLDRAKARYPAGFIDWLVREA